VSAPLTPRALELLAAVEREVEARRRALADAEPAAVPAPAPLRADPALLAALEMGVAGLSRDDVARRLVADFRVTDPAPLLDAVFAGSMRLRRAATPRTAPR
jgi:hypothetical protein